MRSRYATLPILIGLLCLISMPGMRAQTTQEFEIMRGSAAGAAPYTGIVRTIAHVEDTRVLSVTWETTVGDYEGLGITTGAYAFATAYGANAPGTSYGVAVYQLAPNEMPGVWTDSETGKIGYETITGTPYVVNAQGNPMLQPGKYSIQGENPNGTRYAGSLILKANGTDGILAEWQLGKTKYRGTGFMYAGMLVLGYGQGLQGIALYDDPQETGDLQGVWLINNGHTLGTEHLHIKH